MPTPKKPPLDLETTWRLYAAHVAPGKVAAYRELGLEAVMGRREGVRFWQLDGERSWINCHSNGGVFNLGHRHPRVVAAVREALEHLDVGNHHLVSPWRAELARRLVATTGGKLPGLVFGVSGGEAMDLALKVCRGATGRAGVVSARGGYHGHTGLAMAAGDASYREPFGPPLPGFRQVPFDDLEALDEALDDDVAAVVLEPVPATLGMPICGDAYLPGVAALCRERGAKLVLDEVQTGLGRTGPAWCYEHHGLEPDAVVTGKGLSGGVVPITATLLGPELHAFLARHPFAHISTFGGAEIACPAALAALDVIRADGFRDRVEALAARVAEELGGERAGQPFRLRQRGLMMGLDFGRPGAAIEASRRLFAAGLFTVWAANDDAILQFLPPLVISDDELDEVLSILRSVLG